MERGKTPTGNKKDLAARALLVAFETKDSVVKCAQEISKRLEMEYSGLNNCEIPDPLKVEDSL